MANTILTPTAVTRAVAVVLHQQGKLLKRVNLQYDAQEPEGRKAGGTIKIRMPNQFTVRTTSLMATQDISEQSETLTIASPFGVDFNFSDSDLALSMEDFTKRVIEPAAKALVAGVESAIITDFANSVANMVDDDGNRISFLDIQNARRKLLENLAPDDDNDLSLFLSLMHQANYADSTKGLFNPVGTIGAQYKNGFIGPVAGVGWVGSSSLLTDLTTGTCPKTTAYTVNGAAEGANGTFTIQTGTGTFKKGEVVTFAGCNAVHPETKADLGFLKQFVVTADAGANAVSLSAVPAIGGATGLVTSGARQNVTGFPTNTGAVVKVGAGNAETLNRSLYFHRDAYAVAFADLENPRKYGAWGDVQQYDGISVRVWRQGDIVNGKFPGRLDVLVGFKAIRPQMACRIHADG